MDIIKFKFDKKQITNAILGFIVLASVLIFGYILINVSAIFEWFVAFLRLIKPIIYAFVFAYLFNPILCFVESSIFKAPLKKKSKRRLLSMLITYLFVIGMIILFFYMILPQIASSVSGLFNNYSVYVIEFEKFVYSALERFEEWGILSSSTISEIIDSINDFLIDFSTWIPTILEELAPSIYSITKDVTIEIYNIVFGFIISIYVLGSKESIISQFKKFGYAVMSPKLIKTTTKFVRITNEAFSNFIGGKLLDSFIVGIICFVGATILGIPYAILISVLVGVCNIIPYFGPFIGAIPSIFIVMLVSPAKALWLAIFLLILQQVDGNYIGPKILGGKAGINSFWVITAIVVGGGLFGIIGMIVSIPILSVVYLLLQEFVNKKLKEKNRIYIEEDDILIYGEDENPE